jgi:putative ABC transport system permease protein
MALHPDLRLAFRSLRHRPAWAATAVATLALGIGANATILDLIDRLMLAPPPHIEDPARVVRVGIDADDGAGGRFVMTTTSFPVFTDLRHSARSFAALAAASKQDMVLGSGAEARSVHAARVTGGYFRLLGAVPRLGRFLDDADDEAPTGQAVAVLSYALWRRDFGASPAALSRAIELDGTRYRVIGVAPPDFTGDDVEPVDVWVPISAALGAGDWRDQRQLRVVEIVGRLRSGVSLAAAREETSLVLRRGRENAESDDSTVRSVLTSITPGTSGGSNSPLQGKVALWVAAMSMLVLVIAIVNVTNLLLLRAASRHREVSVRLALGATPARLARAALMESMVLAALGGTAALFVAAWGGEALRATLLPALARSDTTISSRLLAITLGVTLGAGFLTGLVPAVRAARAVALEGLKQGGGMARRANAAAPAALLVAQSGLSMVLLVAASLFVLSLHRARTQDFGFRSAGVLYARLRFSGSPTGREQDALYRAAAERVSQLPGVQVASVAQAVPFLGHNVPPIAVPDRPGFPDETQQAPFLTAATPTYFQVMGMRLLEGRNFTDQDREGSALVVIINQAMAEGLWPGASPLGRCIQSGFVPGEMPTGIHGSPALPCRRVVGVVNNARPRSIREEAGQARMMYYVPFGQLSRPVFAAAGPSIWGLLIRTTPRTGMTGPVRHALQSFTSGINLAEVTPLSAILERQVRPWLLGATMFSIFGLLALGLAAIGLYGVRAYSVAQRTREIGIRVALGAVVPDVVRMILAEGVRVVLVAILMGGLAMLALSRYLGPLLFQTAATDLRVYGLVASALVLVTLAASVVPAWRAARVDPNVALREE